MKFIKTMCTFSLASLIMGSCYHSLHAKQSMTQTQLPSTPKTAEVSTVPTAQPEEQGQKALVINKALQDQYDKAIAVLPEKMEEIRQQLLQGDISPSEGVEKIKDENQKVNQLQQKLEELAQKSEITEEGGLWNYLKSGAQAAMASIQSFYVNSPEEQKLAKLLVNQLTVQKDATEKDYQELFQEIADVTQKEELKTRYDEIKPQFDRVISEQKIIAGLERSTAKKIAIGAALLGGTALAAVILRKSLGESAEPIIKYPDTNPNKEKPQAPSSGSNVGETKGEVLPNQPTGQTPTEGPKGQPVQEQTPTSEPTPMPVPTPTPEPTPMPKPTPVPTPPAQLQEQKPESKEEPPKSLTQRMTGWVSQKATDVKEKATGVKEAVIDKVEKIMTPPRKTAAQEELEKFRKERTELDKLMAQQESLELEANIASGKQLEAEREKEVANKLKAEQEEQKRIAEELKAEQEKKEREAKAAELKEEKERKARQEAELDKLMAQQESLELEANIASGKQLEAEREKEVANKLKVEQEEQKRVAEELKAEQEKKEREAKAAELKATQELAVKQEKERKARQEAELDKLMAQQESLELEANIASGKQLEAEREEEAANKAAVEKEEAEQLAQRLAAAQEQIAKERAEEIEAERELLGKEYEYFENEEAKRIDAAKKLEEEKKQAELDIELDKLMAQQRTLEAQADEAEAKTLKDEGKAATVQSPPTTEEAKPQIEPIVLTPEGAKKRYALLDEKQKTLEKELKSIGTKEQILKRISDAETSLQKAEKTFYSQPAAAQKSNNVKSMNVDKAKKELEKQKKQLDRFDAIPGELEKNKEERAAIVIKR